MIMLLYGGLKEKYREVHGVVGGKLVSFSFFFLGLMIHHNDEW